MQISATIHKLPADRAGANLVSYAWVRHDFSWSHVRDTWLRGLPGSGGWNIGYEAVDRHLDTGRRDKIAVRFVEPHGSSVEWTFAALGRQTSRFANLLATLGVERGDTVRLVLDRMPEHLATLLGALRYGAVAAPVPPGLRDAAFRRYLTAVAGPVLVTTPEIYDRRIAPIRQRLAGLRDVLVTGDAPAPAGTRSLSAALAAEDGNFRVPPTDPTRPAMAHLATGDVPDVRVVRHPHGAVVAHYATGLYALDLHPDDVVWCTADPGRIGDTVYGILAPLLHGATTVIPAGGFDPDRWAGVIQRHRVSVCVLGGEPLRALMRTVPDDSGVADLSSLRLLVGDRDRPEPDAVGWAQRALGRPLHDVWWQPETGAIVLGNLAGLDIRPGSAGLPMPGADVAVLAPGTGPTPQVLPPDAAGELAIGPGWPSMAAGVACGWYRSGIRAQRDADGYVWLHDASGSAAGRMGT